MSTNFYAKHPGMDGEGLHIGKKSAGWEFLFRAHPTMGLMSSTAWRQFLGHPWVTIVAEHGVTMTASEFWEDVAAPSTAPTPARDPIQARWVGDAMPDHDYWAQRQWRDEQGHPFADYEFC